MVADPKVLFPKKVSFVLYDVSGSMGGDRSTLRNALILAYLDHSQKEVIAGQSEHVVYFMAFDSRAHEPERVEGLAQAQTTFDRIRAHPVGGSGGTDITGALVNVYGRIAQQQKESGELARANILILTDADDSINFDNVKKARDKIDAGLDIRLNAITIGGSMNAQMTKLVDQSGGEGTGRLGVVTHQHLNDQQIQTLINGQTRLQVVNNAVGAFSSATRDKLNNDVMIELKNRLVGLESSRETESNSGLASYRGLLNLVEAQGPETNDSTNLINAFKEFRRLAISNTSSGWTKSEKLEAFWTFLSDYGKIAQSSGEEVLTHMSEAERQSLRQWWSK